MGTKKDNPTPPAKEDFESLVPYQDTAEAMVEALAEGATKYELIGDEPKLEL